MVRRYITSFFVILLQWYAWLDTIIQQRIRNVYGCMQHIQDYFENDSHRWRIYPDHAVPITYHRKKRSIGRLAPHWIYNASHHILRNSIPCVSHKKYRIGWLSAEIELETTQHKPLKYSMDGFLESLVIESSDDSSSFLSLSELFLAWCIFEGKWFSDVVWMRVHVLDQLGEDHMYHMIHTPLRFELSPMPYTLQLNASDRSKKIDTIDDEDLKSCTPTNP